jgi:hypothetical protein
VYFGDTVTCVQTYSSDIAFYTQISRAVTWGMQGEQMPLQYLFKNSFFWLPSLRGENKKKTVLFFGWCKQKK